MNRIFSLLDRIEQRWAVYIGRKSISRLSILLGGYELALNDILNAKLNFNGEFQKFVECKFGKERLNTMHWTDILAENRSQEEAFDLFYVLLKEFEADY